MTCVRPIFPSVLPSPALDAGPARVIEAVGVEVLDEFDPSNLNDPKVPANRNDVIPFASTLRRVG